MDVLVSNNDGQFWICLLVLCFVQFMFWIVKTQAPLRIMRLFPVLMLRKYFRQNDGI